MSWSGSNYFCACGLHRKHDGPCNVGDAVWHGDVSKAPPNKGRFSRKAKDEGEGEGEGEGKGEGEGDLRV